MATWKDVRRISLSLPEVTEGESRGNRSWSVMDNVFLWERPLRKSDLEALGASAPKGDILAARVENLLVKENMLLERTTFFFTTPHFEGYPAILVNLKLIPLSRLEDLVSHAWRSRAPKRVLKMQIEGAPNEEARARRGRGANRSPDRTANVARRRKLRE